MEKKLNMIDIANLNKWKDVKRAIKYYYPEDSNDYKELFYNIQKWEKVDTKRGEFIEIRIGGRLGEDWDGEDEFYDIATNKYSMSFRDWKELASLPISKNTLEILTTADILAHFIWEITYYGNEIETKEAKEELFKSVDEFELKSNLKTKEDEK